MPPRVLTSNVECVLALYSRHYGHRILRLMCSLQGLGAASIPSLRCAGHETGWAPSSRFATLSFGAKRDFQVKHEASGNTTTYLHKDGEVIYLPCPMNQENFHCPLVRVLFPKSRHKLGKIELKK